MGLLTCENHGHPATIVFCIAQCSQGRKKRMINICFRICVSTEDLKRVAGAIRMFRGLKGAESAHYKNHI